MPQRRCNRVRIGCRPVSVCSRPDQLQYHRTGALDQFRGRSGQATLPDPGFSAEHDAARGQRAGLCPRPTLDQPGHLTLATHQRTPTAPPAHHDPFAQHLVMNDQALHTLPQPAGASPTERSAISGATSSETTTAPGGAKPDTCAARLAPRP